MTRDVQHLVQLRHERQSGLKLIERQRMNASEVAQKIIMENGQLPVLRKLYIDLNHPRAQAISQLHRVDRVLDGQAGVREQDRKSTRLNSSHGYISYAVFCLKKKKNR